MSILIFSICSSLVGDPVFVSLADMEGKRIAARIIAAQSTQEAMIEHGSFSFEGKVKHFGVVSEAKGKYQFRESNGYWEYEEKSTHASGEEYGPYRFKYIERGSTGYLHETDKDEALIFPIGRFAQPESIRVEPRKLWFRVKTRKWKDYVDAKINLPGEYKTELAQERSKITVRRTFRTGKGETGIADIVFDLDLGGHLVSQEIYFPDVPNTEPVKMTLEWTKDKKGRFWMSRYHRQSNGGEPQKRGEEIRMESEYIITDFDYDADIPMELFQLSAFNLKGGTRVEEFQKDRKDPARVYYLGESTSKANRTTLKLDDLVEILQTTGFAKQE